MSKDVILPLQLNDEPSLLASDATWSELWTDMPLYEMGSTEPVHTVKVRFRDLADVDEFLSLMGDRVEVDSLRGSKTVGSMWFNPESNRVGPSEVIYTSDRFVLPRYPVYIPSLGRWKTPYTARALEGIGVPHRVVVEPSQRDDYARALGGERLLVLPENFSLTKKSGSIPVRNWIWDYAVAEGHARHWIIDDNIRGFLRVSRNRRIPVADGAIFRAAEDFTDRWENVALSGFNYMYFVNERMDSYPPLYLNTRVYSMILVNHALGCRWRGQYNEDTDLSLRALKDGWCTILFNAFVGDKIPTLLTKGGNTDTIYATGDKRRAFAESLVKQHPDVARVVWRYDRWHHEVDYSRFRTNQLVPRGGWKPPQDPEYGMKLVRRPITTRYPQPSPRAITPVTLNPKVVQPLTTGSVDDPPTIPNLLPSMVDAGSRPVDVVKDVDAIATSPVKGTRHRAVSTIIPSPTSSSKLVAVLSTITAAPPTVALAARGARHGAVSAAPRSATSVSADDPFLAHHAHRLAKAGRGRLVFDAAEWDYTAKTSVGLDVEVYPNFFLVCFKRFSDGRRLAFEMSSRSEFDAEGVRGVMASNTTVSFNGLNYDLPIITAALDGADIASIFELSQAIIKRNERQPWSDRGWNHVDLFEVNPSTRMGLKVLHGRLHGRWMVDLPFPPEESLTPEQINVVTLYCMNDLDATEGLRTALLGPLELRAELGRRHGVNLLSKSDAQVGEAIVRARLGSRVGRPNPQHGSFRYTPPSFLSFRGEELRSILAKVSEEDFTVDAAGHVTTPSWTQDLEFTINATTYSMGIGGLHSTESRRALFSDAERFLLDVDASSQYPNIIIGLGAMGLHPAAAGPNFTPVYAEMVRERLEAKAAGDRVKADGLKIATNGVFGKLASSYSFLYSPQLMLATTLTGQLSLLMLAECAEDAGVHVISANTDGLTFHCPRDREDDLNEVLEAWELKVGMTLERTRYSALYSRDVNTYLAVKDGGGTKRKGWIANPWADGDLRGMMQKNPQMTVLSDAVAAHLTDGVPLETTIDATSDPRAFVTVIQAKGKDGASWRGRRLGRVVRYYWSTDGEPVVYTDSGRRVAKTEGARPMMELTDRLPNDLDRARYVAEAEALLADLGMGLNLIHGG